MAPPRRLVRSMPAARFQRGPGRPVGLRDQAFSFLGARGGEQVHGEEESEDQSPVQRRGEERSGV